jgi:hypothetical protein
MISRADCDEFGPDDGGVGEGAGSGTEGPARVLVRGSPRP